MLDIHYQGSNTNSIQHKQVSSFAVLCFCKQQGSSSLLVKHFPGAGPILKTKWANILPVSKVNSHLPTWCQTTPNMFNFSLYRRKKKNKAYAALALDSSQQASTASKHLGIKTNVYSCEVLLLLHPLIIIDFQALFILEKYLTFGNIFWIYPLLGNFDFSISFPNWCWLLNKEIKSTSIACHCNNPRLNTILVTLQFFSSSWSN